MLAHINSASKSVRHITQIKSFSQSANQFTHSNPQIVIVKNPKDEKERFEQIFPEASFKILL